ncbi:uncharacterized protein LOC117565499 isoform X1 [Drosophila albomicans]|uniref:Uncharacterized protein LOC117565499 isoform X1 n=1 Tax=Drosophila albomicans TaxID=7291 RepID=A0A6P8WMH7_DROAB|nr:uncharacterized protein LOC117565499 isoform X1 [Drosophila albomicans]
MYRINGYTENNESVIYDLSGTSVGIDDTKDNNNNNNNQSNNSEVAPVSGSDNSKMHQRRTEPTVGSVQLTPLWEHVLRTRRLPEAICPATMFGEFHERLQDPEWQVRQHALRVLVDVLVVMKSKADKYSIHFLVDLIKNLGHQAPTVRKGALDCLRVYLAETAIPEVVMLQILDIGLNHQSIYERLSCGVLLSLPALLQSILHTPQRHFIVKHTIERILQRLQRKQAQQEFSIKVLAKISELLGLQEFESYLHDVNGQDALALYRHLCKVYLISNKPTTSTNGNAGAWRAIPREYTWRGSGFSQASEPESLLMTEKGGKVIMETEIKINDDTLTMRILEAETETEETDSPIMGSTELVCRPLASATSQRDLNAGILQIISDSEMEEIAEPSHNENNELGTPIRGLKRVTFGGEVVKMRTPDSDAASSAHNNESTTTDQSKLSAISVSAIKGHSLLSTPSPSPAEELNSEENSNSPNENAMTELTLEIPIDNTKPLPRAHSAHSPKRSYSAMSEPPISNSSNFTSPKPEMTQSPAFRCRSISPAGSSNVSPKVPHKEIEVLHNLQRDLDPSPRSMRRIDCVATTDTVTPSPTTASVMSVELPSTPNTWEDLDIVSYKTIMDLRSGDWRNRLQGISQLEIALSSSANLVQVLPCLDSLLRTLLSSERNLKVSELKREVLVNLISRLPLDNLEERTHQILSGLCRQGNVGANRVCKALMQHLPAGTIVAKLTAPEYLHAKSSKFRDHALQMSIFALMTFPGTCFDISSLSEQVTYAALNRKRRVRQAALEVLAVLADISSAEQVLEIVADIAAGVESGTVLLTAVKTRLSRPQLPVITSDGAVLYIFHKMEQMGISNTGADIDWITQGDGSASPNSMKRRHMSNKKRVLQERTDVDNKTGASFKTYENLHRHSFHSPPEALDMSRPNDFSQKKNYGTSVIQGNFMERRLVTQAYSESSIDGRSSDSTTTTCSSGSGSGSGSFIQLTPCNAGLNRRLVRQNSRFPVMRQHTDFINNFMRNGQRTTYPYSFEDSNYPKVHCASHKIEKQQPTRKPPTLHQQANNQKNWITTNNESQENAKVNETIKKNSNIGLEVAIQDVPTSKSMIMVEPENKISTAPSTSSLMLETESVNVTNHNVDGSPLSIKSTSYSQKSTASAKSYSCHSEDSRQPIEQSATRNDLESINLEQQFGDLVVNDVEDETDSLSQEPVLKRNESVNSLHSKTESIKTQLEDATPQMSRAQSIKSLAIEEEIESTNSFVVVEELQHELESPAVESPVVKMQKKLIDNHGTPSRASSSRKSANAHDERTIHSRSISLDSLYGARPVSKQDSLDTSLCTTDNSSHTGSQLENIHLPAKVQHTPLKQKSKTSYFLRGQRRISPVKQAIKMSQTELFPPNMTRFEKPRDALIKTFDQLDSSNWEINMTGLKSIVRLIRYHSDFLDSHMHMTCIQLTRSVRNLRSQVARASCQAATELFTLKCKSLEVECDDLVCALLHRTADTNRFLRADATRALESMVDHLQPPKVLTILTTKGAQHQNALVRTTTAKLLFRLVERLGSDRIYAMARESRDKFFMVGANLLLEGSLETRSYAKSLFRALSEHASYQRIILEVIPPRTYRNVEKTLRSITR